ncbi:POT family-domain-containing protein [Mycena belliarum]|uniref:POT family-domain-containing protein n=1 Tax=Mycena belliarum TaxID=1033014 RepID=A0AAD6TTU9_9AGAR|nr:POT family-domain-containing protein [Mycena belliae]
MAGLQTDVDALAAHAEVLKHESAAHAHDHDHDEKHLKEKADEDSLVVSEELDGVHDGLEFPTELEKATLRRVSDTIPWNAYLIAAVEAAERFSFYGCTVVFTNFVQHKLPPGSRTGAGGPNGISGALGKGQQTSTGIGTFYQFWCYVTPLVGAWIADAHLGRFNTIIIGVLIALVGHVVLIVSAIPGVIDKPDTSLAVFALALVVIGFGTGLFKSNISPLRVIVDPVYTVSRVYMYFYLFINVGALVGQITMAYSEKYVGFYLAYTLPTAVFLLCPLVLIAGRNRYVRSPPTGSVLALALRAFRFAARGKWSLNPLATYRALTAPAFWDAVRPSTIPAAARPAWMVFDDAWVDELRRGLKACWVFAWFPLWWLTYNQLNNNLVSQAATMTAHGLPNDVLSNLDPFALIIFIPISDKLIYPALKRRGWNFTALKKICAGFFTGAAAMIWAAVVQHYIYKTNPCGYHAATCEDANGNTLFSSLNIWTQTGSYVLVAFSEILASITGLEYAFTKAPKNMRSLVMSVFLFTSALASALGEAFVSLSTDPLLVWNYGSMAVIAFVAGILFWVTVRETDAQEDELNELAAGHVHSEKLHATT